MQQKSYDVLNRPSIEAFISSEKMPVRLILDDIRSGLNIGSAFRTGDAFGIEGIELCGICAVPPHREILKTSLGATESVTWNYHENTQACITSLKEQGYTIAAIEIATDSISLEDKIFEPQEKIAFVFGNEVKGILPEVLACCDIAIEIPQVGTKHSFNISVSLGIVLWEYFRQYRKNQTS